MSLAIVPSVNDFFNQEIEKISRRHGLQLNPVVLQYLSEVLVKFASTQELKLTHPTEEKVLTPTQFWLEIQKLPVSQQFLALQFLGDYSLFTSGFFNDHINKSLLDMDYFQALGGQAYYRAGEIRESISSERALNVYFSLAESFRRYSEMFSELFDQTLLHSSDGAIKLFEKWQQSGSEHLSKLLREEGFYIGKKPSSG